MKTQFELLPEHITLLSSAFVQWEYCETGAPAIDPKRPYGNSNVEGDIAEMFGWEYDHDEEMPEELYVKCVGLHLGTERALEIILRTKSFEPGLYEYEDYSHDWKRI